MLKFMSFTSGSCGNCYYFGDGEDGLLIDAGISLRRLKRILEENNLSFDSFSAILVTHDHLDHIRHLGAFCKRLSKPVYASETLHNALASHTFTRDHIGACRRVLASDQWNKIGKYDVHYFVVPHDATQTVGYAIESEGERFVIMTDIGRMTDEAVEFSLSASNLVIESNYDIDMLLGGPYTHELKMRIIQGCGHLSNDECASALRRIVHKGLKNVFLCHLSENNNTPELAHKCVSKALSDYPETSLRCLPRRYPSALFNL